jgi:hypothetical protein
MKEKVYNLPITLEFKTVSPLFEMERDGIKPFTTRLWDNNDSRFITLATRRYKFIGRRNITIKIVNPANGESFCRRFLSYQNVSSVFAPGWVNIWLGEVIP